MTAFLAVIVALLVIVALVTIRAALSSSRNLQREINRRRYGR